MGGTSCSCNDHCGAPDALAGLPPPRSDDNGAPQMALAEHLRSRAAQSATAPGSDARAGEPAHAESRVDARAPGPLLAPSTESAPSAGIFTFRVRLSGGQSSLGFEYIPAEDGSSTLMVTDVLTAGAAVEWNSEQLRLGKERLCLQRGDRIAGVAGTRNTREAMSGLLAALTGAPAADGSVECEVERWPELIPVSLHRREASDRLGMQVELIERADKQKVLRIGRISGGLLGEWNQRAVASRRFAEAVMPGSEIERVGGISGDPDRMRDEVMHQERLEIVFRRLDPEICKRMSQQIQSLKATGAERPGLPVSAG